MSRISKVNTKSMNNPKGKHGFIFKLKPEQIDELLVGLKAIGEKEDAAVFVNIYENESKFSDGPATYLNSTISVEVDQGAPVQGSGNQTNSDSRGSESSGESVEKAFTGGGSRRGGGRRG